MMQFAELWRPLTAVYDEREARAVAKLVLEEHFGLTMADVLAGQMPDDAELAGIQQRLLTGEPVQYVLGWAEFCERKFHVEPGVLIPRPETEEMVKSLTSGPSPAGEVYRILDLCTGSGCIAIALKKAFPRAEVTAVDVSPKALAIAQENAQFNDVDITFVQADILAPHFSLLTSRFSLIISNPPYVMERERAQMAANVLDYDPALALFVPDDDPLRFYKAIAEIAKRHLSPRGMLVVEINEALAEETCTLLREYGLCPAIHIDFRGKQRWISAAWNQ